MDALPEELLAKIISHIHNHSSSSPPGPHPYPATRTLYALCLTSRKLHRVATPYLYASIHSTSGAMGKALYQTLLAADPDSASPRSSSLRNHVREFAVQHATGGGCRAVDKRDVQDAEFGKTFDVCQVYLARTIALLPRLEVLDLSRFVPPKEGSENWLTALWDASYRRGHEGDWAQGTGFGTVRRLALHLGSLAGEAIWMVFRLPALRELEVDIRSVDTEVSWGNGRQNDGLWPVGTSGVEVLRIIGLWGGWARVNDVKRMSRACRALSSVFVAVSGMQAVKLVPHLFKQHIESRVLEQLQIAVQGLWEYEMSVLSGEVCDKLFDQDAALGGEMMDLMIHATGHHGMGTKDCYESERVKITSMRELSADEKKAYDTRLGRRP